MRIKFSRSKNANKPKSRDVRIKSHTILLRFNLRSHPWQDNERRFLQSSHSCFSQVFLCVCFWKFYFLPTIFCLCLVLYLDQSYLLYNIRIMRMYNGHGWDNLFYNKNKKKAEKEGKKCWGIKQRNITKRNKNWYKKLTTE